MDDYKFLCFVVVQKLLLFDEPVIALDVAAPVVCKVEVSAYGIQGMRIAAVMGNDKPGH
jgi:ABC-type cobalamin transport system ATPase subunit